MYMYVYIHVLYGLKVQKACTFYSICIYNVCDKDHKMDIICKCINSDVHRFVGVACLGCVLDSGYCRHYQL